MQTESKGQKDIDKSFRNLPHSMVHISRQLDTVLYFTCLTPPVAAVLCAEQRNEVNYHQSHQTTPHHTTLQQNTVQ